MVVYFWVLSKLKHEGCPEEDRASYKRKFQAGDAVVAYVVKVSFVTKFIQW
jgi:hypothetical protein